MTENLDYSPLKHFHWYKTIHNMLRKAPLYVLLLTIVFVLFRLFIKQSWGDGGNDISYSYSGYGNGSLVVIFWLWVAGPFLLTMTLMSRAITRFTKINHLSDNSKYLLTSHTNTGPNVLSSINSLRLISSNSFKGSNGISTMRACGDMHGVWYEFFVRYYKSGVYLLRSRKTDLVICLKFGKPLPHVIFDRKAGIFNDNLISTMSRVEDVGLGGMMSTIYDIYIDRNDTLDAFVVWTPDLLQMVYNDLNYCDLEMKNDSLWLIWHDVKVDDTAAKVLFLSAELIAAKLRQKL
jgi:hypothetical protein